MIDEVRQSIKNLTETQERGKKEVDHEFKRVAGNLDKLTGKLDRLTEAQDRLTENIDKLTQSQDKLTKTQDKLTATQDRLAKDQERGFKQLRDRVNQSVGGWDNRWGKFIETLVSTGTSRLLRLRGIKIDKVIQRVKDHINPQPRWEIDVLAKNSTLMVAIETKHYLTKEDVDEAIEKFKRFKKDYQDCSGKILYGAVGYLDCETKINQYAERKGLFVFQATGDSAVLINEVDFQPEAL